MLLCVTVCYSVLLCVTVCYRVLRCVTVCYGVPPRTPLEAASVSCTQLEVAPTRAQRKRAQRKRSAQRKRTFAATERHAAAKLQAAVRGAVARGHVARATRAHGNRHTLPERHHRATRSTSPCPAATTSCPRCSAPMRCAPGAGCRARSPRSRRAQSLARVAAR